jgi:hypothetical protein
MKRALTLTLVLAALGMLAGCGGDGAGGSSSGGKGADVRGTLPEGAIAVVYFNGDHPDMDDTALSDIWNEPGMKEFFEPVWEGIRELIRTHVATERGAPDLLAMEPLLKTQMAVALYLMEPPAPPADPYGDGDRPVRRRSRGPQPAFVAVARVGGDGSPLRKAIIDGLKPLAGDQPVQVIDGVTMTPLMGGMALYGFKGDLFIAGMQPMVMKAFADDAPKLTASAAFVAMTGQTDLGNEVIGAYFDAQALLKVAPPREAGDIRRVLATLGLERAKGAALTWSPRGKGMATTFHLATPTDTGLVAALTAKPVDEALLKFCPKDVEAMCALNLDMPKLWDGVMNAVSQIEPRAAGDISEGLAQVESKMGIRIRDDLLASFDEGTLIAITEGGILLPNITLVQKLKNPARADTTLTKLLDLGSREIDKAVNGRHRRRMDDNGDAAGKAPAPVAEAFVQSTTYRGQTIKYANFFLATPAYTIKDGYLIAAASPVEIKDYLDVLDRGTLAANADWQAVRKKLSVTGAQGLYYGDFKKSMKKVYYLLPLLAAMGTTTDQVPMKLDVGLLPGSETIAQHLFGAAGAWVVNKDGITSEVYSPSGTGAPLASIASLGMMSGMLIPAFASANRAAEMTYERADARQLEMDRTMRAIEADEAPVRAARPMPGAARAMPEERAAPASEPEASPPPAKAPRSFR